MRNAKINFTKLLGFTFLVVQTFSACQPETQTTPLYQLLNSEQTGITFSNELPVDTTLNIFNYMYYYNGGGLAAADFNNDGLIDLLFSSNLGKEKMYLNKGNMKFTDVTSQVALEDGESSWTNGVSVADVNGDGLQDIYLSQVGSYRSLTAPNKLFICTKIDNNNIPHYKESAGSYGLAFRGFSTQAGFFDYDLDGDLDLYLMNHSLHHNGTFGQRNTFQGKVDSVSGDKLFRNDNNIFTDVSEAAGINSTVLGYGLGLAFGDVNMDGYPDIYIGNDFHENDYLYINQGDGTFKDDLTNQLQHTSRFSMGVDIADVNGDAFPDIISLDMLPEDPEILKRSEGEDALDIFRFKLNYGYAPQYAKNALQINNGNNRFSNIAMYSGIHATDWSWSPLLFDMDLDGRTDVFISNGIPKRMNDIDYIDFMSGNDLQYKIQFDQLEAADLRAIENIPEIKLKNKFFLGNKNLVFEDIANNIDSDKRSYSNSAIYADLDNDGDLDIVTNNINDAAFIYENIQSGGKSITIILKGDKKNTDAIGAKIMAYHSGKIQLKEKFQVRGFQSSMNTPVVLSGAPEQIDSILVIWPDHKYSIIRPPFSNKINVSKKDYTGIYDYKNLKTKHGLVVTSKEKEFDVNFKHKENPFVEFNREILIPHSTSTDSPALAIGDLNGDGLEDIFIGSSKRKKSAIFYQNAKGKFEKASAANFSRDSTFEEVDAIIFDINKDGYNDLIIANGGNEFRLNNVYNSPSLYLGSATGKLIEQADAFDNIKLTASTILPIEFTGDGLPDLFIGARAVPWAYGEIPKSYFLKNNGNGTFSDVSKNMSAQLSKIGFVKSAAVADMDRDGHEDIVLALEWDAITILYQNNNTFKPVKIGEEKGWWNVVLPIDIDQDGDLDIIAGNQGLNNRFKANFQQTVRMYYDDFDENGTKEQILTYYQKGKEIPFANKKELQKQLPFVKKKFIFAKDFAKASLQDIFPPEKLKNYFTANHFESTIYQNDGNGNFTPKPLPDKVQWSTIHAGIPVDLNKDDLPDLLLMGNYHDANIQMGRNDASYGTWLENLGNGHFKVMDAGGENINGQVREVQKIKIAGEEYLVLARNNAALKIITLSQ